MIGFPLGIAIGLLELIPNLHPQVLVLVILPWLGLSSLDNLLCVAAMLTTSLVMHTVVHTYHPIPQSLMPHAEAAQKLCYGGHGPWAMRIQLDAIGVALLFAALAVPALYVASPLIKPALAPLSITLAALAVWRSQWLISGVLVLGAAVATGFFAQGYGTQGMLPLLTGLFTIPPLLHLLVQGRSQELPDQEAPPNERPEGDWYDVCLGVVAAYLPGISASSMVHLRQLPQSQSGSGENVADSARYLTHQALQHNSALFGALFILALTGRPHSAAAVALFAVNPEFSTFWSFAILVAGCALAMPVAEFLLNHLAPFYVAGITLVPQKLFALLVLPVAIGLVVFECGAGALWVTAAAAVVSLMQKAFNVPNQVLLQALTLPVVYKILA